MKRKAIYVNQSANNFPLKGEQLFIDYFFRRDDFEYFAKIPYSMKVFFRLFFLLLRLASVTDIKSASEMQCELEHAYTNEDFNWKM